MLYILFTLVKVVDVITSMSSLIIIHGVRSGKERKSPRHTLLKTLVECRYGESGITCREQRRSLMLTKAGREPVKLCKPVRGLAHTQSETKQRNLEMEDNEKSKTSWQFKCK